MKTIGVLGGMGPLATVDLYDKIVRHTNAHSDAEHIHVMIDSYPEIPDRTAFILGGANDPTNHLIQAAKNIERMGADFLVMPCNTAHYFYEAMAKEIQIPFIHMIKAVERYMSSTYPNIKKVALLATEGTYKGQIYQKSFASSAIEIIIPSEGHKKIVNELIYTVKDSGVDQINTDIEGVIESLKASGAEAMILGCTELPIAFEKIKSDIPTIDPTLILAIAAIQFAGAGII